MRLKRKFRVLLSVLVVFLIVYIVYALIQKDKVEPRPIPVEPTPHPVAEIPKIDDILVLVDKKTMLPEDYVPIIEEFPSGYAVSMDYWARPEVVSAYVSMVDAMNEETGLWMYVTSAYRGYSSQERLFNNYVSEHGEEMARRFVAYPGTSEHQTGLTLDLVTPNGDMFAFGDTEQSGWVSRNAHKYGFVIRYEVQHEDVTGYMAEPWHLRYLGSDVAREVYESKKPFDDYYHSKFE